jgi:hypothetical protein
MPPVGSVEAATHPMIAPHFPSLGFVAELEEAAKMRHYP